ncbi:RidA family protein [Nocardiopsis suaedae]|uniref:RidA family protein n=1 Tax=Nocardiopsis suaedae TaxID=3018444 RepID=A0ABT4TKU4_9ACTN|nr:RidA family protein [Nocardiopsis suaedae]MDA2805330.1 RidA family protein [Nocardiopsis suaedae]
MSEHIDLIRSSDRLTDDIDYAYAAVTTARTVYTAGACPLDVDGSTVAPGDFQAQARRCVTNLEAALDEAGAALTDVVKYTVYVASSRQEELVEAWDAVRASFGGHDAPATLLGVAALGYDDQLVEVEAVAALK